MKLPVVAHVVSTSPDGQNGTHPIRGYFHTEMAEEVPRGPSRGQEVPRGPSRGQEVPRGPSRGQEVPRGPSWSDGS